MGAGVHEKRNQKMNFNTIIEAAVLPLKDAAVERAAKETREMVGRYLEKIDAAGGDVKVAFPYPNSLRDSKPAYVQKRAQYGLARRITKRDASKPVGYKMTDPEWVVRNDEGIEKLVAEARTMAAQQYDAFVAKLTAKIGECVEAVLAGNHVWGHSILTVTKADGSVERWKTQQIVNQSVLGTLFNQWPTRKVK